jgi:predicted Zn-dependent protease
VNSEPTAPRPRLAARYHDGLVARAHTVDLSIGPGGIVVSGEALRREYDWSGTRVSERLQLAPRLVRFSDGSFCEVADHEALDAALASIGYRDSWVARSQGRWSYVFGAAVLLMAAIWAGYRWALPAAADIAARRIPPEIEIGIGARATKIVEEQFAPSRLTQERRDHVRQVFDSIAPHDGHTFALLFRFGGQVGANAFALPGGTVFVTDELVELAPDDDALAGVLAHEIGHVENRHLMRQIISGTVLGVVSTLIASDASGLMAGLPATLANLSYSRDMERQADQYAVDRLKRKGIPLGSFASLLEQLQSSHAAQVTGWASYLATHPDTADRIAAIRAAGP